MKNSFVKFITLFFLSLLNLLSFSTQAKEFSVDDIGVIGPNGEVFYIFIKDNNFNIKTCDNKTVLPESPTEAAKACKESWDSVSLKRIKPIIINYVLADKENKFKLDPKIKENLSHSNAMLNYGDEYQDSPKHIINSSRNIFNYQKELIKINIAIASNGGNSDQIVRKAELEQLILAEKNLALAIKPFSDKIDALFKKIEENKVYLLTDSANKNSFEYLVLYALGNGSLDD